jgi:hypothetical protein
MNFAAVLQQMLAVSEKVGDMIFSQDARRRSN